MKLASPVEDDAPVSQMWLVWSLEEIYILSEFVFYLKKRVRLPFFREAQTCTKESFFVYADDTDSMNDDMK